MNCADEASEDDHHTHSHSHSHTHPHGDPPVATTVAQSLNHRIDTPRLAAYNLRNPQHELPRLFKTQAARLETTPVFRSHFGPELLITIPFTGPVKLFSLLVRAAPDAPHAPHTLRLYRNAPQLSLDSVRTARPTYVCEHPAAASAAASAADSAADTAGFVEHHLPRRKFAGTSTLTIFFDPGPAADPDAGPALELYALELRGDWAGPATRAPVALLYESAARREDHPVGQTADAAASSSRLGL